MADRQITYLTDALIITCIVQQATPIRLLKRRKMSVRKAQW